METKKLKTREIIETVTKWGIFVVAIFGLIVGFIDTVADLDQVIQWLTSNFPGLGFLDTTKNTSALLLLIFSLFVLSSGLKELITFEDIKTSIFNLGKMSEEQKISIEQVFDINQQLNRTLVSVLKNKLPSGVSHLFLNLNGAPRFTDIFRDCKVVKFFGPEGALILSFITDEATKLAKNRNIQLEMYLPDDPEELAANVVRPDFGLPSKDWRNARKRAEILESDGRLKLKIFRINFEPTISALQVDDSYFQITMLFPLVANSKRPTLIMDPIIAKDDYFRPLWTYLKGTAKN